MASIVIIEKDDLMRGLLTEWLTAAGYGVVGQAPRGTALVRKADLVILDVYMPRQGGADTVRSVQHAYPGTPMIAISAQFRAGLCGSQCAARALGVSRVVAKPLARDDLLGAVRALIGDPDTLARLP